MGYKAILTALVSYIAYLMGGYDMGIKTLFVMITVDYMTGIMKAIVNKNLNSYIGWRGMMKKCGILLTIIVAVQIENITNQPETIHNLVAFAFVVNEGVSILENLIDIGVPVPDFLIKFLKKMKDDADKAGDKNELSNNPKIYTEK